MSDKPIESSIACPNCGHNVDVNHILQRQVEDRLKKRYQDKLAIDQQQLNERITALVDEKQSLELAKQNFRTETEKAIADGLQQRQAALATELKQKLEAEQAERLEAMNRELGEKTEQLKSFHKARSEIERLKREKEEMRLRIEAEAAQKMNRQLAEERGKLAQSMEQKHLLDRAERDKVISDLNQQLKDAQRRAEQGSMQLQGEVQELAIEQWLKQQFPFDTIEEIKKGANGADCLQTIQTRDNLHCGTIYYESKRTKVFSPGWIEKFRQDIREKGADVGVLVTSAMPSDMNGMGLRDGIWVCNFDEFRGLSTVLRDAAIRLSNAVQASENKGDKMEMLYDFLTGNEFRLQVEGIVEGFTQMQSDLESEKRSMQMIWKKREKQIDKVLANTNHMYGSIKGIAGNAVQSVSLLELDSDPGD